MNKLLMRFFDKKDSQVPLDSHVICSDNSNEKEQSEILADDSQLAIAWMKQNPKGKVDLIWV